MSKKLSVRDTITIGMLAAVCTVATTIKVPFGNGAMVHLGSAAIYTFAILFGGMYAGFAGAIGSALFDIAMGFSPYTLWSFVIKGVAGFIAGSVSHSGGANGKSLARNILALVLAAGWTLAGYLVAWTAVLGKFEAALANAPSSLMTSSAGILIAIPFAVTIRVTLQKAGLLKR